MANTFIDSPSFLFTSESVTEGHPDKLCDQISDAVLDAILAEDPMGRVACETATTTGLVMVMGEITTSTYVDIANIVRRTIRDAGYIDSSYGFDHQSCGVAISIHGQSQDISSGVTHSVETRGEVGSTEVESLGAGDQGMMVGYACNETPELMPVPMALSHRLCQRLAEVRKDNYLPYLRPDGKSQVTIEYEYGVPKRAHTVVISTQHNPEVSQDLIERDMIEDVIRHVIPADLLDSETKFWVNPSGRFVIGGPVGDAGLTGRKILVDTYGGMGRHGGGAFSGKDPSKVDRSAAYMGRYAAKNIVAARLAKRCEIQFAYAIGYPDPVSVCVDTFGTGVVDDATIAAATEKVFSFKPADIVRQLKLLRPIYSKTTNYGHFGKEDDLNSITWEKTDKVAALKRAIK